MEDFIQTSDMDNELINEIVCKGKLKVLCNRNLNKFEQENNHFNHKKMCNF